MRLASRHLCLTVLLALLVGHASFAVHVASHDGIDATECQLCISYGNASEALCSEPGQGIQPLPVAHRGKVADDSFATRRAGVIRQRGPPPAS